MFIIKKEIPLVSGKFCETRFGRVCNFFIKVANGHRDLCNLGCFCLGQNRLAEAYAVDGKNIANDQLESPASQTRSDEEKRGGRRTGSRYRLAALGPLLVLHDGLHQSSEEMDLIKQQSR